MKSVERLARSSALVVGAGGLGSPASLALAASGVGRIGLVDDDAVDLTNLARQILHRTMDVCRPKVESGAERLGRLQPGVTVEARRMRLDASNAESLVAAYDVVVDGSDNLSAKLMLNEVCVRLGKPLVTGAILRFFGQLLTVLPGGGPCYRCLVGPDAERTPAASCASAGVIGAVAGFIGMAQAADALRVLAGLRPAWVGRLMTVDLWRGRYGVIEVARNAECETCGRRYERAVGAERAKT